MIIGIRREDKNEWEARVPLTPSDVAELCRDYGFEFRVQPSPIRAFSEEEFLAAGAKISEDLSACDLILAVKEIPSHLLLPAKTYLFFSHTIKGQKYNMPMLKRLLELRATLIDYERIVDENGRRLVFFGRYAGIAGMLDTLWAWGQRLSHLGYDTPLAQVKRALEYRTLEAARTAIQRIGEVISAQGLPPKLSPAIIGFTGYGHVSQGAQEIAALLPVQELTPEELPEFVQSGNFSNRLIYKVVFKEADLVRPVHSGATFDLQEYYQHPERYSARFSDYLPYLTIVVNGIYWDARYPRLITKEYLRANYPRLRLQVIGDISCDIEGAVECTVEATTPGNPVYVYDPQTGQITYGVKGTGPVILAVDNLPCELPRDASQMFSRVLKQFIPPLARCSFPPDFAALALPPELRRATIVYRGELTPDYRYLAQYIEP